MSIDKRTISRPIITAAAEDITSKDMRTPRKRVVDAIVARLRSVDNYGRGVDLEQIQAMCENDLDSVGHQIVQDAGGWSAFTLANTDGKQLKSFREGQRIIIVPGKAFEMQQLQQEIEEMTGQGVGSTTPRPGASRPIKDQKINFSLPSGTIDRDSADQAPNVSRGQDRKLKAQKSVVLSRQNQELLKVLPSLLGKGKTEFFKDVARQDAMRLMRAMTLLVRFRHIFVGRSYGAIISRLEEEGDVKRLGGIDQLFALGVQAGFLEMRVKEGVPGHVATSAGAALLQARKPSEPVETAPNLDLLDQQLRENYQALRPTKDSDRVRQKIVRDIQKHLDRSFQAAGLQVELFGSSGTGLYFPGSDCDICAYYATVPPAYQVNISQLSSSLRRVTWCSNIFTVAFAKIPVVKLVHTASGLPIDISIENTIAIENSRLIRLYMELDERVKPLAFALKVWCKSRAISHPEEGSLSSYSWVLMLIHFLQRVKPHPVLPNLQRPEDCAEPFTHTYNGSIIDCYYNEFPTFKSGNISSVATLFAGFFEYFATFFDFDWCVSIDESGIGEVDYFDKQFKRNKSDWLNKSICIQDPFIEDRNTGVGCSPVLAEWTFDEIARAHRILSRGGSFADVVTFLNP